MTDEIGASIDSSARYVLTIVPLRLNEELIDVRRYDDLLSTAQVQARGWYFPHIERQRPLTIGPRELYCESKSGSALIGDHPEEWRLYRNGQFLFRAKLLEDGDTEVQANMRKSVRPWRQGEGAIDAIRGFVSFVSLIYSITETFEFAARLAQAIPYESAVEITVGLRGTRGWAIGSTDPGIRLSGLYTTATDKQEVAQVVELDVLVAKPFELAIKAIQSIFRQFGWANASDAMIAGWQREIF